MSDNQGSRRGNRYTQLIEHVFFSKYVPGALQVEFERSDIERAAADLGIKLPKNRRLFATVRPPSTIGLSVGQDSLAIASLPPRFPPSPLPLFW